MTPLRLKMEDDLRLRNLAATTQVSYLRYVARFASYYNRSPALMGTGEVRAYLLGMTEQGRAPSTVRVCHAALCFLYSETLGRPEVMKTVPRPRVRPPTPRPPLTLGEAKALLDAAAQSPFLYTFISTLLSTGLRISEACVLQPGDIDRKAGLVHVRRGKGGKPRIVKLDDKLYRLLRRYWVVARPGTKWLFPARKLSGRLDHRWCWADHPVSSCSFRDRLARVVQRAELNRTVTPHDLRRTYATWLCESGVHLRTVQALLGHSSPNTTVLYTAVRPEMIQRLPSLLEQL